MKNQSFYPIYISFVVRAETGPKRGTRNCDSPFWGVLVSQTCSYISEFWSRRRPPVCRSFGLADVLRGVSSSKGPHGGLFQRRKSRGKETGQEQREAGVRDCLRIEVSQDLLGTILVICGSSSFEIIQNFLVSLFSSFFFGFLFRFFLSSIPSCFQQKT